MNGLGHKLLQKVVYFHLVVKYKLVIVEKIRFIMICDPKTSTHPKSISVNYCGSTIIINAFWKFHLHMPFLQKQHIFISTAFTPNSLIFFIRFWSNMLLWWLGVEFVCTCATIQLFAGSVLKDNGNILWRGHIDMFTICSHIIWRLQATSVVVLNLPPMQKIFRRPSKYHKTV